MRRTTACLVALALLWIMFARMLDAAARLSPVVDEQSHISRGLLVIRTGDLRLRIGHPIGLNVWEALPLAFDPAVQLPLDHESWVHAAWDRFGDQFLWRINANPDGVVFRSRLMVMLLTLALGALVYRWAGELYGPLAGVLALTLYSLDPNVIAHGALATTDIGVALFMCAAAYALWRAVRSEGRCWHIAAGVFTGLALISKYSALALFPIFAVLFLLHARRARSIRSVARRAAYVPIVAVLVVLAVYLLRIDLYLDELGFLIANTETHPSFLLGQRSIDGWWYYFIVTFLLKTPLPTLLLIGLASVLGHWRGRRPAESFLLAPALLYFAISLISGFNVGYRHLLPALPLLLVYASKGAQPAASSLGVRRASRMGLGLACAWLAVSSAGTHPDYLAYFNEMAPSPRYSVLVDSNLDWGQSLKQLRAYLAANTIDRIHLSYFGTADPTAYGIDYDPLPRWPPPAETDFVPANPAPGVYAISASNLQGVLLDDPSAFDWFRHRDPVAIVGQSILVYHVAADPNPPQAVGLCREPWTPIEDEQVDALFGRRGLRVVRFDCADAWWWPEVPAWYVVPPYDDSFRGAGVTEYERRRRDDSLVYRVFREERAACAPAREPLDTPARFDGGLTLQGLSWLGGRVPGATLEVESAWCVDERPWSPVSIFAHLLDSDGVFVSGADGFGVPAELLRPGDAFVQRHRLEVPPDAPEGDYRVEFGFYRLDTLERYPVIVNGQVVDQRVLSGPVRISR